MRLLDRLTGARDPERADFATSFAAVFGTPNAERITPDWRNAVNAYKGSGVVFGVESARINLFAQAQFKFQRKADKSLWGDERLKLLENPWPGGSTADLLARMEQNAALMGNAWVHRVSSTRLEMLRPDWVTLISELTVDPESRLEVRTPMGVFYQPFGDDAREPDYYPIRDVAHWAPHPDPDFNHLGMSYLTPVLREVDADLQMTDYKRAYLENAATPNLVVKYTKRATPEMLSNLAARFRARHGGVKNAFKTIVLDEGADVTMLGNNMEQMTYAAVQAAGENRIAVAAGVPAIVAGLKEGLDAANYAVFDAAMRAFADGTMRWSWETACQALEWLIDVPEDSRLWYDEAAISALRQGEKDQADTMFVLAQAYQALVVAGVEPSTAVTALSAGDITLVKPIPGFVSVQMQPGTPSPKEGTP